LLKDIKNNIEKRTAICKKTGGLDNVAYLPLKDSLTPAISIEPNLILVRRKNKAMKRSMEIKLTQLSVIFICWFAMGFLISGYDHLVLLSHNSEGVSQDYSFLSAAKQNVVSALIGALLGGSFLVFYINPRFQNKPYGYTVVTITISFAIIILIIIIVKGLAFGNGGSAESFAYFLHDTSRVKNIAIWFLVVLSTQFLLQVSSKVGQNGLVNILRGRYNTPHEENKIFMFLDLNSSTSIAEKLGDEAYHQLLRDFFSDITDPILNNKGEIYQYVGDEVVVAWSRQHGVMDNNCVRCYFNIVENIKSNEHKYLKRYGLVPEFRAGLHSGKVVAGEVGIVKREITYSGDVLNTTSRILSKGKEIGAGIISSTSLLHELTFGNEYIVREIGAIKLKGKQQEVYLNEILLS
jgi:adenylate cyclase